MVHTEICHDWEFVENGETIKTLSAGFCDDGGRELYFVLKSRAAFNAAVRHDWVRENVLPHLPVRVYSYTGVDGSPSWDWRWDNAHPEYDRLMSPQDAAILIRRFVDNSPHRPRLWAYFSAYDHVSLAQMWGPMIALPSGIPMLTHDLRTLMTINDDRSEHQRRERTDRVHHALDDARWDQDLFREQRDLLYQSFAVVL